MQNAMRNRSNVIATLYRHSDVFGCDFFMLGFCVRKECDKREHEGDTEDKESDVLQQVPLFGNI